MTTDGKAYLIGAGPGDPRLLTLRGADALREADVILVDELVHPDVLAHARPDTEIVHVGKRCGGFAIPQALTTKLLIDHVRRGAVVARLKGGDPLVFGRGGEEAAALAAARLPFEIIPGVSAALGAAASACIPLTYRGLASSVTFVAGQSAHDAAWGDVDADTLVVYMCQRTIHRIARELIGAGRPARTPAAIVRGATWRSQEVYTGCLGDLAALEDDWHEALDPRPPTLAIIGEVAALAHCAASPIAALAPPFALPALGDAS
jgi:uroporphyrin-III C-methyltransferase